MALAERLARAVLKNDRGCWIWIRSVGSHGYGQVWKDGSLRLAHRVSYEVHRGPIPEGMVVMHTCDVPRCINPDHLMLGTAADNAADRDAKGRSGLAKLDEETVRTIRRSTGTTTSIAQRYGIASSTCRAIRDGVSWRHVQ